MRMQGEKGTVIGEKSMKNEEYKKLSIKEFTKAAGRYESNHAGIYEMCKKDYPDPQAFFDSVKRWPPGSPAYHPRHSDGLQSHKHTSTAS